MVIVIFLQNLSLTVEEPQSILQTSISVSIHVVVSDENVIRRLVWKKFMKDMLRAYTANASIKRIVEESEALSDGGIFRE